jgi:hypothetical protein
MTNPTVPDLALRRTAREADDRRELSFLGKRLPPAFVLREVALLPGGARAYDEEEWRGALVVVEHGEVELECVSGDRRCFDRGAVFWLFGLPLRALHNTGDEPALLVAVSRRPR